jgi:hypothetical protein
VTSSPSYGATPPYETAIVYTLRPNAPADGFYCRNVRVVGRRAGGVLHEWHKRTDVGNERDAA